MQKLKVSLIITTYNWPEALFLVLKSVKNQFTLPDEIIIADDGSSKETENIIRKFSKNFKLKIIHSWQEDRGFRAAMSRNKAIAKAENEYIIMTENSLYVVSASIQTKRIS